MRVLNAKLMKTGQAGWVSETHVKRCAISKYDPGINSCKWIITGSLSELCRLGAPEAQHACSPRPRCAVARPGRARSRPCKQPSPMPPSPGASPTDALRRCGCIARPENTLKIYDTTKEFEGNNLEIPVNGQFIDPDPKLGGAAHDGHISGVEFSEGARPPPPAPPSPTVRTSSRVAAATGACARVRCAVTAGSCIICLAVRIRAQMVRRCCPRLATATSSFGTWRRSNWSPPSRVTTMACLASRAIHLTRCARAITWRPRPLIFCAVALRAYVHMCMCPMPMRLGRARVVVHEPAARRPAPPPVLSLFFCARIVHRTFSAHLPLTSRAGCGTSASAAFAIGWPGERSIVARLPASTVRTHGSNPERGMSALPQRPPASCYYLRATRCVAALVSAHNVRARVSPL